MNPNNNYKLKLLFHLGFHDYPLNGLAEYNGQEVYFCVFNEDFTIKESEYPQEIIDIIARNNFVDDLDDEGCMTVGDYTINKYEEEIEVNKKLSYKIYKIPVDTLTKLKTEHNRFCEMVGYWHDPQHHKSFVAKEDWKKYYEQPSDFPKFNESELEYLGTFNYDEFQYFSRPHQMNI